MLCFRPMRKRLLFLLFLALVPCGTWAATYESPKKPPMYFDPPNGSVDPEAHIMSTELGELNANVQAVQCGGWIDDSMAAWGDIIESSMEFPGRSVKPFENIATGMGGRWGFSYPDNAYGFMSSCDPHDQQFNPDRLCLIAEGTATPEQCRQLYEYWLSKAQDPPQEFCDDGTAIPTCYQDTEDCTGSECRTPLRPMFQVDCDPNGGVNVTRIVSSFYRHYITDDLNAGAEVWSEGENQVVKADCYEYYDEQDARFVPATPDQKRCELVETDESDGGTPEWITLASKENFFPAVDQNQFNHEPGERGILSPWFPDTKTNIAFLDTATAKKEAEDAGEEYDEPDMEKLLSYKPKSEIRVSSGSTNGKYHVDSFDDATDPDNPNSGNREIVRWWQEQERRLLKITHAPSIRLVIPARFATGLDPDDPLIQIAAGVPNQPKGFVELELRANSDDFGRLLDSLHRSWILPIEEVRIPVLVPIVSEAELDNIILEWKLWGTRYDRMDDAEPFIERFESYKNQVNRVRLLREALAHYLSDVLNTQQELRGFFANWYIQNAERLQLWNQNVSDRQEVAYRWREISKILIDTHDGCELQWCSNARYTAPIYSLLDPWMPDRPSLKGLSENEDYVLPDWGVPPDISADFSDLTIDADSMPLPVLDVTQIKVRLPHPPTESGFTGDVNDLPQNIPTIPDDQLLPVTDIFGGLALPQVHLPDNAKLIDEPPPPGDFGRVYDVLDTIRFTLEQAQQNYCEFTRSIEAQKDGEDEQSRQFRKIVHTEFDLRERVGRLFARRAPLWKEDYMGRGQRIATAEDPRGVGPVCDGPDCIKLPPEKYTTFRWHIEITPGPQFMFQQKANEVRGDTTPFEEWDNPYDNIPIKSLRKILTPIAPVQNDLSVPRTP